jgi:uncharacterized protein (TIGR02266 family)
VSETDYRKHPRTQVTAPVTFKVDDGPWVTAESQDISLGGMFVQTSMPAPYGARIVVRMQLPGLRQEAELEAVVRWSKSTGMGVQFGRMGARETHALTQLIGSQR